MGLDLDLDVSVIIDGEMRGMRGRVLGFCADVVVDEDDDDDGKMGWNGMEWEGKGGDEPCVE